MSEYRDEPRRIPHPSTLPPTNITRKADTEPLHQVQPVRYDPRVNRLLPAALVVGATGTVGVFTALITPSFLASVLFVLVGVILLATAGVILYAWDVARRGRDHGTGPDLDVEDWQRWNR